MLLVADDVSKTFGGLRAVDGVSLGVAPGEIVGLIGPNGAGKTTLFNLLTGFSRCTTGRVLFDDRDVSSLRPHRRVRQGLARTFQIPHPFADLTVGDHFRLALMLSRRVEHKRDLDALVHDIADRVHLSGRVDIPAKSLTLGELKLLEVGRALGTMPRMVLLDEPFGGVGTDDIPVLQELLVDLRRDGITILIIEHVLRAIMQLCDRIVVLSEGRLLAEGEPTDIVKNEEVIGVYLGDQYACQGGGDGE